MSEVKPILRRMGFFYLLLAVSIIPCGNLIPDRFPTRNISAIYLLALSVCLVCYYAYRVAPGGVLPLRMKALSWMALLLILFRGIKYSAFSEVDVLARHVWYLYYVPMLLLPLFLFDISLLIFYKETPRRRVWIPALTLTAVLIALILTNDLHEMAFRFRPGFADWDRDYTRGWLFYAATVWQYALYLAAIVILVIKSRVESARKSAFLLLIPFAVGIAMCLLLLTGRMPRLGGAYVIEFPEALICMAAVVLEVCIQLGMIPTNANYGALFPLFSVLAQITDQTGAPVYASGDAAPLTAEQLALPDGARIGAHTVLHRLPLPGGFGFWQDDLTELDLLNDRLEEAAEALRQEAELIRLRSALKERRSKIEQRTEMYDTIARHTQRQSAAIQRLAGTARASGDPAEKDLCRRRITLLGAYLKRYANLTLLSQEHSVIETGELGLSVSEVLRYLNGCGIPGEFIGAADCAVPAPAALAAFECFETLLERNLPYLQGLYVTLSAGEDVTFKMAFEHLAEPLTEGDGRALAAAGVLSETQCEDDVTYIRLTMPKGGGSV